jgi:hypothetical protein
VDLMIKRLLPALMLAMAAAGCASHAPLPMAATAQATDLQARAVSLPWTDPSMLSAVDDPADPSDVQVSAKPKDPNVNNIMNFKKVNDGLYRGGLPSKDNLAGLKALGVKTTVTLMGEVPVFDTVLVEREKLWAKSVGIKFIQCEVPTGKVPFSGKPTAQIAADFLKVITDPANQPCFVHCLHGRDRTGTMVAVYRMTYDHLTNQQAFDEMKTFGFNQDHYPALAAFVKAYKPTTP